MQLRLLPLAEQRAILQAMEDDIGDTADERQNFDPRSISPESWQNIQDRLLQYTSGHTCLIPFEEHIHCLNKLT